MPVAQASPVEETQSTPWGIEAVNAPALWPVTRGRGTVNVAVFDTGIDATHPDVGPNVVGGYNVLSKLNEVFDDYGHGTHVAGTIAALDNGFGVVGVAPEARLWSVKVLGGDGKGSDETIVAGIDKVLEWKRAIGGQWIVSLSIGSNDSSDLEKAAFQRLADEDVLAIAAAGNQGRIELDYPAAYPTVMAIAAIDEDNVLANFSNHGLTLAVVAPGVNVVSTYPRGTAVTAAVRVDGQSWINGFLFIGAPRREVHGEFVACGLGKPEDFPADMKGKIALIVRGEIPFAEKVRNAVDAGAIGAMVYNYDETDPANWTLYRADCSDLEKGCVPWSEDVAYPWPVAVALTNADGLKLLAQKGSAITIGTWVNDYKTLKGTSMATPHVSGVAALLWSLNPTAHSADVRSVIVNSARDLGAAGYDDHYGFGLVDAAAAAKLIAPSVPIPPTPQPPRRRATH